jgi:hypothetical protein
LHFGKSLLILEIVAGAPVELPELAKALGGVQIMCCERPECTSRGTSEASAIKEERPFVGRPLVLMISLLSFQGF